MPGYFQSLLNWLAAWSDFMDNLTISSAKWRRGFDVSVYQIVVLYLPIHWELKSLLFKKIYIYILFCMFNLKKRRTKVFPSSWCCQNIPLAPPWTLFCCKHCRNFAMVSFNANKSFRQLSFDYNSKRQRPHFCGVLCQQPWKVMADPSDHDYSILVFVVPD